ncbi:polyprenyl synthetase family protein [uncultured Rhodoblastus sp.]|uniref:polyprenyl synthetase family protein n=1 Tax=uncultured Rhodoblastus sp. TaxID=543037 RepID=UPI0025D3214B|nr:polyprenyl synthetase family protein [uncultured Rhodoblastus sp.]
MQQAKRVEMALEMALAEAAGPRSPPLLAAALRYALFPGGHRIRPQIVLSVARACGDANPEGADAAAAAIELLHSASLIHDDLPAFDDAGTRRGKPSVHVQFGEPIAVLAGDALIILAYETLGRGFATDPRQLGQLVSIVSRAVGAPGGIVAGQAWESETAIPLVDYQRAKTGALFAGATLAGAAAAGWDPEPWRALGEAIGEAYQVADDLRDLLCSAEELGKPVGQDERRARPNAATQLGIGGAKTRLTALADLAADSIPACPGAEELRAVIRAQTRQLFPSQLAQFAA